MRSKFASETARISLPDARAALLHHAEPLSLEMLSLEAGTGRVLARTYRSPEDLVPFARSAMDGYAMRATETFGASVSRPCVLPVTGASFAGGGQITLSPASACAITTGAMLPGGADAVVPFEDIERVGDTIVLRAPLRPLDHVFEPGDDAKRGDTLVVAGTVLSPGAAALLASAGFAEISTYRRPRVAIVSTGDEVVAVAATPRLGQIRNSNAAMLASILAIDGATVVFSEHANDDAIAVRATLERALASADLVITTGGASTGERDYVKRVVCDLGAEFIFDSIALRPAKPTAFAALGKSVIAMLPGNPAAAYVAYVALVRGVVRGMSGLAQPYPPAIEATLCGSIQRKPNRHFLMFASVTIAAGRLDVVPLENQCSSLVRTSADANALIVVEPGTETVSSGALVRCELVRGLGSC